MPPAGTVRPRYNVAGRAASIAKAKEITDGKHNKRKRGYELTQEGGDLMDDSNAEIIDEVARKKRKDAEIAAQKAIAAAAPNMSSKKKKRLDAYIVRKLKKEGRKDLIASLATTQTQSLSLRSSSSLGSKQFLTQDSKLSHYASVEEGRRERAKGILKRVNGKGHLSDDDEDEDDASDSDGEGGGEKDIEMLDRTHSSGPIRSIVTLASKAPPPFNASGSLGIVHIQPSPSTSTSAPQIDAESNRPQPPPASIMSVIGSGLKAGVVVEMIKKKPKEQGRMRAMVGMVGRSKDKGKGKEILESSSESEEEEEEESNFDSSDSGMDGIEEEEKDENGKESDGESWHGIDNEDFTSLPTTSKVLLSTFANDLENLNEEDDDEDDDEDEDDDGSDGEEDDSSDSESEAQTNPSRQKGSFLAWAESQVLSAAGLTSTLSSLPTSSVYDPYVPLLPAGSGFKSLPDPTGVTGPLGAIIPTDQLPSLPPQRTTHIVIERTEAMIKQRAELPIVKEEDRIMEAIRGHAVVVICGETGSGKTTQIGQFLWEGGWGDAGSDNPGMVAITQPRRVAALSTSLRVRAELCLPPSSTLVAHRIRYSSTTGTDTKLVFMTDGVLLRELAGDFLLSKYSVVVIDEAHERGVNTDVLIGVLSRVARLREEMWKSGKDGVKPLRLIIMSATLRVSDFAENTTLFKTPPPVLNITTRQHPVTLHFTRQTASNYSEEAYKKVARIHARLPPGGILVFCTGQNEIVSLVKKLEKRFSAKAIKERKEKAKLLVERDKARIKVKEERKAEKALGNRDVEVEEEVDENEAEDEARLDEMGDDVEVEDIELGDSKDLAADVDDGIPEEDEDDLESSDDEDNVFEGIDMEADTDEPMYILPLYSLLSTEKQMKVFEEPPPNTRLVVIATNVAETSITIPNVKYVVDAGRAKERQFDVGSGIQSFEVSWISKAAAAQRAGRAGRTGPGHCYRLYSSAVFENYFDQHTKPEILRMPIEGIILQMKSMNIDAVSNFPFPTPPDRDSLRRAEKTLVYLGALEASESSSRVGGKITELGRSMAQFPLSPRFSKMLVAGQQHGCLPYVIAIVCAISVGDPFIRETNLGDEEDDAPDYNGETALSSSEISHIRNPELRHKEELKVARKAFFESQRKYAALGKGASDVFKMLSVVGAYEYDGGKTSFCEANFVRPKAMQEIHKLRAQISKIVQATYPGIDAGFVPKLQPPSETQLKVLRQLMTSAFIDQVAVRKDLLDKSSSISYSKVASTRGVPYRSFGIEEDLFIHPSSGLFHSSPPEFIVYQDLHRTHKVWLKTITKINPSWLPTLGKPLCTFSKPIETSTPSQVAANQKLSASSDTRTSFVVPRFGKGLGIELKPIQITQKLVQGRWVMVE